MVLSLCAGVVALFLAFSSLGSPHVDRWVNSAGLLFTVSGVFQLEVSGLFSKLIDYYGNTEKFPFGPPSHITRQVSDEPDRPIATQLRNALFFRVRTGFWLIVAGTLLQLAAVWS